MTVEQRMLKICSSSEAPDDPSRRWFLRVSAGSLVCSTLGCTVTKEPPASPAGALTIPPLLPTIDVHCHIFNARDLPIRSFVRLIVFEGKPIGVGLDPLVTFLSFIMDQNSPTATDELAAIAVLSGRPLPAAPRVMPPLSLAEDEARKKAFVVRALDRLRRGETLLGPTAGTVAPAAKSDAAANIEFVNELARRYQPMAPAGRLAARRLSDLEGIFDGIKRAADRLANYVDWAYRYTLYRYEILGMLGWWPGTAAGDVKFFCPAIIDYAYWLGQFDTTPLPQQAMVLEAISRMPQRPGVVHGYIAFDPWRQIVEPSTLDVLKDAVLNRGFVGVKVYPPMGFRPIGNAALAPAEFPAALQRAVPQPGPRLDDAMRKLYDWCVADDVPIEAHCSYSQFPNALYGARAAPDYWEAVLEQYPTLRLNLGHCGGPWDMATGDPARPGASQWTERVIRLLGSGKYPNLYADFADAAVILDRDAAEAEQDKLVTDRLRSLLAEYPKARSRLMYGSDWSLLGREYRSEAYYSLMKGPFCTNLNLNDSERAGFLGGNAARFLGLAQDTAGGSALPATRQRLEAFYRRNALDPGVLDQFINATPIS